MGGSAPHSKEKPPERLKPDEEARCRQDLADKEKELRKLQGETPLVHPVVDRQAVAEVVSGWTGIPVGKMVMDEIKTVLSLKDKLEERVIGQSHALEAIAQRIRTARANLVDPRRPIGVFLLVGPSGVGKTETAMALSDILYGGDRNLVVINMSEYKEEHKISRLTGSAPGYVGYGEGGVLTEAVRRKPYSIVLLDEVEKAHTAVQEIFYQVFDKGTLQDDKGEEVDFKNTIILLTSNVGTDTIMKVCADPDTRPEPAGLAEALRPDLLKAFKPALLGRMTLVPYYSLADEVMRKIIQLQLTRIAQRMRENHRAAFTFDEALIATIAGRCKEVESGARNVDHILTGTLLPDISREVLARLAEGTPFEKVHVGVDDKGQFVYRIE
jgi:type VI secretion system protein VasG